MSRHYNAAAIALHRLIAALILINIAIAWYFNTLTDTQKIQPFQLHKSIGICILLLSCLRVGLRLRVPPPPLPSYVRGWERVLAQWVHTLFYVIMLGMPLSGWAAVSANPLIKIFPITLFGLVHWPAIAPLTSLPHDQMVAAGHLFDAVHSTLAKLAYGLIVLHVVSKTLLWPAAMLLTICAVPAAAAVSNWRIDPAASRLTFRATMSGASFTGAFRRWTAKIAFDPKTLAASKVEVSVEVGSAVTGDKDRDQSLPTADWFSASAFPTATFVSRGFKNLGGGKYLAIGDLKLRGVSRPVNLPFTLFIAGDTAKATGSAVIDRTAFGVGQGQWKTGSVVGTKVTALVTLVAHKVP